MRWALVISLVLAISVMAGCDASAPQQTPSQTSQVGKQPGTHVPGRESQIAVAQFFQAIIEGDRERALNLWSNPDASVAKWIAEWIEARDRISIDVGLSEEYPPGHARVPVTITVRKLVKSPQGVEWTGLRFAPSGSLAFSVQQAEGDWKIDAVMSPPDPARPLD